MECSKNSSSNNCHHALETMFYHNYIGHGKSVILLKRCKLLFYLFHLYSMGPYPLELRPYSGIWAQELLIMGLEYNIGLLEIEYRLANSL